MPKIFAGRLQHPLQPSANLLSLCSYWSDPVVLEKMSKVMGDVFNKDEGASGLADGDAADGEEAAEDEPITLHSCARDGGLFRPGWLLADSLTWDAEVTAGPWVIGWWH